MKILYAKTFAKQLQKAPVTIQAAFYERLAIFLRTPFDQRLNNHKLLGQFTGKRSINVTGDWRAIFEEAAEDTVRFLLLGTHSELYG